MRRFFTYLAVFGLGGTVAFTAAAQTPGDVRAQGQSLPGAAAAPSVGQPVGGGLRDPREDMRQFVQAIRTFAQTRKRSFAVVTLGGIGLAVRPVPGDEERTVPARGFLRSIDGMMVEAPFAGIPQINSATDKDRQARIMALADLVRANRVPLFSLDYATETSLVRNSYNQALQKGFIPFVAPAIGMEINRVPANGNHPVNANPKHILSVADVRNFALIRDSSGLGVQEAFALNMHDTNYDMVVVDVFHKAGEALSKRTVETLKYKKLGARRMVLAYLNIGAAESFRFYWQPDWREGAPAWILGPYPGDPEKFFVEYWRPEWQNIVMGGAQSYLYGVIDQGFDGVLLDGLDAYLYAEGGVEAYQQGR
jgi:cysteinyl-tRNA synthetase